MTTDTSVLPMKLYLPWDPRLKLGMGYDYMAQEPLIPAVTSAVERSKVAGTSFKYWYVTDQQDLDSMIEASAEGSGNVEGIQVKASLAFTKSVRFSETSQTLVFSWASDNSAFDEFKDPKVTDAMAEQSRSNPEDFRLRYGDYFVSGGLQRSEFHAVYQMSAMKRDDLLKFKASAAVSSPDVFSASGSAAFTKTASENHVSISATVYQTPSKSSPSMGSTPNLTPAQVLDMFKQFQNDHQDSWVVAELTHYSALLPNLSRVVPVPASFAVDRALLLGARIAYKGLLETGLLPRDAAVSLKSRAKALEARISAQGPLYWNKPEALAQDRLDAETLANDVRQATEFLHRVQMLGGGDGGYSNVVGRSGGEAGVGTHGDNTPIPPNITVREDTFDLKGDWEFATQITRSVDKRYDGGKIIYLRAKNNWSHDTGGTLKGFSGGIGSDHVHFGCESDLTRGLSWSFIVKYVESQ